MVKYVYDFEGDKSMWRPGCGSNLAEMTKLGPACSRLHDHHRACRAYLEERLFPRPLAEVTSRPARRRSDGPPPATLRRPTLVSVRSGAKFSMPGMMETVLKHRPQR